MKQLDIVTHTAIEPEPFGRVVIEAMALGKAVIASHIGGPSEVVQDGKTGVLINPTDTTRLAKTIVDLCRDNKKRNNMGQAARKAVHEKFSSEIVYRNLLEVLRNSLK